MLLSPRIDELKASATAELVKISDPAGVQELYYRYLGRKGSVPALLKSIPQLPEAERPEAGRQANRLKQELEELFKARTEELRRVSASCPGIDITLPGRSINRGYAHPLSLVIRQILDSFKRLGFHVAEGPEIETDYYNFTALNFPAWHPARDMQATFFITDGRLLRTHTSPVQARVMETCAPPVAVVVPGRVYRSDNADATHYPVFHQVEGLFVDTDVSLTDLRGMLLYFVRDIFGKQSQLRFRPSYFPFTEPSVEVDISCIFCGQKGCSICKRTGWIEILGAGMVNPNVLKNCGYDPETYNGFAFGIGIERVAMLKYRVDDIRLFYENHVDFLKQFRSIEFSL